MKRSLYKRLHRTLRSGPGSPGSAQVATAVMVVPDAGVPRWSPGPDWTEMATARMWARPTGDGVLVTVHTYGREAHGYAPDDRVLATGLVTDFLYSLADKRHRIYQYAEPGTLRIERVQADHPAQKYWDYWMEFAKRFDETVEQTQDAEDYSLRYRTLDLQRRDVELRPDGQSWVCSVEVQAPNLHRQPGFYWEDLLCCTDVLMSVCAVPTF